MAYTTRSNTAIQSTSTLPSHLPTSSATSTLERVPDPLSYEEEDEEEDHIVLVPTPTGSAVRNGTTSYIEGVGRSGGSQKRMLLTEVTTTLSLSLSQSEGEEDMEEDEYEEDAMEEDEEPPTQGTEDSGAPLYSPGGGEYRPDGIVTFGGGSSEQGDARMTESEDEFDASEEQRHVDEDDEDVEEEVEEEEEEEEEEEDGYEDDGEREAIQYEMQSLTDTVPVINGRYKLIDRLGEGTFSSVYKAVDLLHSEYDNTLWATPSSLIPIHPSTGEPDLARAFVTPQLVQLRQQQKNGKVFVALKRIYVTSSPVRIFNELDILNDLRGGNNVAYLIAAIRHEDQVIAVMPFNRHQDFRTYYRQATLPMLRSYFASLFRALAATHDNAIIHRDVKPANFLYDTLTGTGVLCDYGLAQKIGGDEWYEWKGECCHSLPSPSWGGRRGRAKSERRLEAAPVGQAPGLSAGLHGVRMARPLPLFDQVDQMEREWNGRTEALRKKGNAVTWQEKERHQRLKPWIMPKAYREDLEKKARERHGWYKNWRPVGIVGAVNAKKERVGYLKEDRRPSVRANRAGTRGFRAPEVLLKCPDQTVSLDVWSAGIILLCFLTRRFPFFNSNDDTEALVEIAAIFGRKKIERCAASHNRTFLTNIPHLENPEDTNFHALVKRLNPSILVENSPDPTGPIPSCREDDEVWYQDSALYEAVDLMKRCLELDGTRRWTAEECLEHPFFDGEYDHGAGKTGPRTPIYE